VKSSASMRCASCGAPARGASGSWVCEFCQSRNYDAVAVEAEILSRAQARYSNLLTLAMQDVEAGDYASSLRRIDDALTEHPDFAEAWATRGLALAQSMNLRNHDEIPESVERSFAKAEAAGCPPDLLNSARGAADTLIAATFIRVADQAIEQVRKTRFAFSHEPRQVQARLGSRIEQATSACLQGLSRGKAEPATLDQMIQRVVVLINEDVIPRGSELHHLAATVAREIEAETELPPLSGGAAGTSGNRPSGRKLALVVALSLGVLLALRALLASG